MANVTMPMEEYQKLQQTIADINARNSQLMVEVNAARLQDPSERVPKLNDLARKLIEILQFSTANLNPRDIKRWPHQAVRDVAALLPALADHSPHDTEYALFLNTFADECKAWEDKRKATPEVEIPPPFPTEDHPIAQLAMGARPRAIESTPGSDVKTDPAS